jgi:broad specificity phosphatase PhoE
VSPESNTHGGDRRARDATLVLVRHGRTTWVEEGRFQGSGDPPLSAHGEAQAAAVATRLADPALSPPLPIPLGSPTHIRHSPLSRAAATAGAIARARHEDDVLIADPDLVEIGQGAWEGLTTAEVVGGWQRELDLWRQDPVHHHAPGGESLHEASRRAARAVDRMLGDVGATLHAIRDPGSDGSPVLGYTETRVGGPGDAPVTPEPDPWSVTVAHDGILRLVLLRLLDLPLERYWSFPFGLCCITVVEIRSGRARLRSHNLDGHLADVEASDTIVGAAGTIHRRGR